MANPTPRAVCKTLMPAAHAANGLGRIEGSSFEKARANVRSPMTSRAISQQLLGRQRLPDRAQRAADPQGGWQAGFQVQIACAIGLRQSISDSRSMFRFYYSTAVSAKSSAPSIGLIRLDAGRPNNAQFPV